MEGEEMDVNVEEAREYEEGMRELRRRRLKKEMQRGSRRERLP